MAHPPAASFTARVDNPWYPLQAGTTFVYRGTKDGRAARDVVHVLQEFLKGQAEDHFRVLDLHATVRAAYTTLHAALLAEEWTIEPGTLDHKLYVRGVGLVLEQTVKGGSEQAELVSVRRG